MARRYGARWYPGGMYPMPPGYAMPPGYGMPGAAYRTGAAPAVMQLLNVTVPDGVAEGQKFQANTPSGAAMLVTVPAGVKSGQTIQIRAPAGGAGGGGGGGTISSSMVAEAAQQAAAHMSTAAAHMSAAAVARGGQPPPDSWRAWGQPNAPDYPPEQVRRLLSLSSHLTLLSPSSPLTSPPTSPPTSSASQAAVWGPEADGEDGQVGPGRVGAAGDQHAKLPGECLPRASRAHPPPLTPPPLQSSASPRLRLSRLCLSHARHADAGLPPLRRHRHAPRRRSADPIQLQHLREPLDRQRLQ